MHNKQKNSRFHRDVLSILISSFIVVVFWIGSNIYHIWATSTIDENVQNKLKPIAGSFDMQVLTNLKKRTQINPTYDKQVLPQSPTPVLTSTPASRSATQQLDNTTKPKPTP